MTRQDLFTALERVIDAVEAEDREAIITHTQTVDDWYEEDTSGEDVRQLRIQRSLSVQKDLAAPDVDKYGKVPDSYEEQREQREAVKTYARLEGSLSLDRAAFFEAVNYYLENDGENKNGLIEVASTLLEKERELSEAYDQAQPVLKEAETPPEITVLNTDSVPVIEKGETVTQEVEVGNVGTTAAEIEDVTVTTEPGAGEVVAAPDSLPPGGADIVTVEVTPDTVGLTFASALFSVTNGRDAETRVPIRVEQAEAGETEPDVESEEGSESEGDPSEEDAEEFPPSWAPLAAGGGAAAAGIAAYLHRRANSDENSSEPTGEKEGGSESESGPQDG